MLPGRTRERRRGRDDQAGRVLAHSPWPPDAEPLDFDEYRLDRGRESTSPVCNFLDAHVDSGTQGVSHQPLELHRVHALILRHFLGYAHPANYGVSPNYHDPTLACVKDEPARGLLPPRKPRDPRNDETPGRIKLRPRVSGNQNR